MNKNKLKVYAPQAREEFIKVVSERAALYGITAKKIAPCEIKGDYAFISGKPFPKSTEKSRNGLIEKIESKGFTQVIEEVAYTWFNRFAAIRFMELNGYLSHGYRVLSHTQGHSEPEILEKAQYLDRLDGLEKEEIIALKTAGNKDAELYRKLIIAQCNELHSAMPFLFERVDDPTELLLPDNLLNTDSVIRQMVETIPEEDWKQVEIIGWLYQFYISDKKDALMKAKKAYKTEDIPSVTQLFTPNWIVKYLVQNSLGAKWLGTYPSSGIKEKMEYYIEPAEQSDEVKQKIKEITPDSLNPEELTVMDPACGSGHILVEAYSLLKQIYSERGYRSKDIPTFILTKNLFGLEIDDRAAQLAGFSLMMKARQDDRQIFEKQIKPNITCLKSANGMGGYFKEARELIELFDNAKTFGSLIRVPEDVRDKLPQIKKIADKKKSGDLFEQKDAEIVTELLRQAEILSRRYDCVIANPPYMGDKGMNGKLKEFAGTQYPQTKFDLFAMFMDRGLEMAKEIIGYSAMITMPAWLFLSSFEKLRHKLINKHQLDSLLHIGRGIFGIDWGSAAFVIKNTKLVGSKSAFFRLHKRLFQHIYYEDIAKIFLCANENQNYKYDFGSYRDAEGINDISKEGDDKGDNIYFAISTEDFEKIPGSPIAYWVSNRVREIFASNVSLEEIGLVRQGASTSDNDRFLKLWFEVDTSKVGFNIANLEEANTSKYKWFPYNKGGVYKKWYGNHDFVINYENDGYELKEFQSTLNQGWTVRLKSREYYFCSSVSWPKISSGALSARYYPQGFIFDVAGCCYFPNGDLSKKIIVAFLNSKLAKSFLTFLSPTLNFEIEQVKKLPFVQNISVDEQQTESIFSISIADWDSFETSWNFKVFPMLSEALKATNVEESFLKWEKKCTDNITKMKQLEEENNRLFIDAYGMQDELAPDVPEDEITLARANKEDDIKRLVSYAIGCMMGRYSLDKPSLVYAHSSNEEFDTKQYKTFSADDDGIVPITDHEWFDDDVACRFFKFIETAWDKKGLDANLDFISESIGRKSGEASRDTIRRYFVNDFYKDHCQTYKKRPIYWLVTSGKEKAFQALVYLHRYNEGMLSRMRTEYVLPLQTKINRHIEHLEKDKDRASSTSAANKIQKEITSLLKQKDELIKFDERLRHYADMKIKLELDDGVKVNHAKFEDLLAKI